MKDIVWNKILLEEFLSIATFTEIEEKVLRSKLAGYTISQQADIFNMSVSSINRVLKSIDEKYDENKICAVSAADFYRIYLADIKVLGSGIYVFVR